MFVYLPKLLLFPGGVVKNNSVNFSQDPAHSSMMCCLWREAFINLERIVYSFFSGIL